ncbi:MAG: hypothetical protein INQ03_07045 [Candidatus Heimdallarchaeota archaeon]|nr:hypothetical protein [Candidatus Heimdallarchaeota archaeon]
MTMYKNYPNPQRLFIKTRNEWFISLLEKAEISLPLFTLIRNSQLGQLILLIQSSRAKAIRNGEDPGPDILDSSTLKQLIPYYTIIDKFIESFEEEQTNGYEIVKGKLNIEEIEKSINEINLENSDWDDMELDILKIDDIILKSHEVLVKILEELYNNQDFNEIKQKLLEIDENLFKSLFDLFNDHLYQGLKVKDWTENENNERVFKLEDEEITLSKNQSHEKALSMVIYLSELIRAIQNEKISVEAPLFIPLLSLEMLIKVPYVDKSLIPVVRENLQQLKENFGNPELFDLLFVFYQIYASGMKITNTRIFQRMYNNSLSTFKKHASSFWKKQLRNKIDPQSITIIWSSFSISIAQLNDQVNKSNQSNELERYVLSILNNLNEQFWKLSSPIFKSNEFEDELMFWSYVTNLTIRQLKSGKQAYDNFLKLSTLYKANNIFETNPLGINTFDKYSLLQKILSFGIEARSNDLFSQIEEYLILLEDNLTSIEEEEDHFGLNLEREREAIVEIKKYLKNPVLND